MSSIIRVRRIEATAHVIHRRRFDHIHLDHRHDVGIHCYCEAAGDHIWAKRSIRACGCSKRLHGQPKSHQGLCCLGDRDRIYFWRREVRELQRLARGPGFDPEADEVWLLGDPTHRRN